MRKLTCLLLMTILSICVLHAKDRDSARDSAEHPRGGRRDTEKRKKLTEEEREQMKEDMEEIKEDMEEINELRSELHKKLKEFRKNYGFMPKLDRPRKEGDREHPRRKDDDRGRKESDRDDDKDDDEMIPQPPKK